MTDVIAVIPAPAAGITAITSVIFLLQIISF